MNRRVFLRDLCCLLAFILGLLHGASTLIAQNLIVNGSFEAPALPAGQAHHVDATLLAPWHTTQASFEIWTAPAQQGNTVDGNQHLEVLGNSTNSSVSQTFPTVPARKYRLSFVHTPRPSVNSILSVSIDSTPIASLEEVGSELLQFHWQRFTADFTANGTSTTLTLTDMALLSEGTHIDDVSVFELPLDTVAPTTPADVAAKAASPTRVDLTWSPSTDTGGSGLASYRVYRDGQEIATSLLTKYSDEGRSPETHYCYVVMACDKAGNCSESSQQACLVTPALIEQVQPSILVNYAIPSGVLPSKTYTLEQTTDLGGTWTTALWPVITDGLVEQAEIPLVSSGNLFFRLSVASPYDLTSSFVRTNADFEDLAVGYSTNNWKGTTLRILDRICPDAKWVAEKAGVNFSFWFRRDTSSFGSIVGTLSSAVHESVHTVGDMTSGFLRGICLGRESFLYLPHNPMFPRAEIGRALPTSLQGDSYYNLYLTDGSGGQDFAGACISGSMLVFCLLALVRSAGNRSPKAGGGVCQRSHHTSGHALLTVRMPERPLCSCRRCPSLFLTPRR